MQKKPAWNREKKHKRPDAMHCASPGAEWARSGCLHVLDKKTQRKRIEAPWDSIPGPLLFVRLDDQWVTDLIVLKNVIEKT